MTTYACAQINAETQACEVWVQQQPLLPDLSPGETVTVCSYIFLACSVSFMFRMLRMHIEKL